MHMETIGQVQADLGEVRELLAQPTPGSLARLLPLLGRVRDSLEQVRGAIEQRNQVERNMARVGLRRLHRDLSDVQCLFHQARSVWIGVLRSEWTSAEAYTKQGEAAPLAQPRRQSWDC